MDKQPRCDIQLKGEHLTMHDRDGKLLLQAVRSMNMLYKVHMGIREPMCLIPMMVSESSRWHIRLGNINHESICDYCLLGKQARQVFPQATPYRASKALELIHGDLCDPISPRTKP